jgi:uridine phosphorylase
MAVEELALDAVDIVLILGQVGHKAGATRPATSFRASLLELLSRHPPDIGGTANWRKTIPNMSIGKTKVSGVPRSVRSSPVAAASNVPLLEHDRARIAIIEPSRIIKPIDVAEHCVLCFFQEVIAELVREGAQARQVHNAESEAGDYSAYELDYGGRRLAVVHPGVGAPTAAARLERMIALGCRKFVACGGAGVLVGSIGVGNIVVPTAAIRDEGTSYHYLPPAREVTPTRRALAAIEAELRENNHDYVRGKTWTTDAVYRETRPRMARRQNEGCVVVDMEAAAFFAVARFRRVEFAQILYGGDSLAGRRWDPRGWNRHAMRERLFHLAAQACLRL